MSKYNPRKSILPRELGGPWPTLRGYLGPMSHTQRTSRSVHPFSLGSCSSSTDGQANTQTDMQADIQTAHATRVTIRRILPHACYLEKIWKKRRISFESIVLNCNSSLRYDTIRDAILACARKPTWVSLIYRTEPTTKKCKKTEN